MTLYPPQGINISSTPLFVRGTYIGDGTENRAIAHGFDAPPSLIILMNITDPGSMVMDGATGWFNGIVSLTSTLHQQTAANSTYFYAGKPATAGFWGNDNAHSFIWFAIY